jgi:hypothetical protein
VLALLTGEAGGGGTGGGGIPNLNRNQGAEEHWASRWSAHASEVGPFFSASRWEQIQPYLGWIALGIVLALVIALLWIYSDCVCRFMLLDAVVTGQCRLREGWRRWRAAGRRYFVWVVSFAFVALLLAGITVGVPALLAYRAGWFDKPEENLGVLIGWGILLALVLIVLVAVLGIIEMFARDFLVPVMAFEDVGPVDGWRRLLAIMGEEKLAYAAYVLMKIVLAVGGAIIFGIANLLVILVLLIPLGLLGRIPHRPRCRVQLGYFGGVARDGAWLAHPGGDSLRHRFRIRAGADFLPVVCAGVLRAAVRAPREQDVPACDAYWSRGADTSDCTGAGRRVSHVALSVLFEH